MPLRAPDRPITVFEGRVHDLRRDGSARQWRWPAASRERGVATRGRRRAALLQLPRVPPGGLRRQLPRRRSPCRSTGGWPRPRCATSSSTRRPGRSVCDEALAEVADGGDRWAWSPRWSAPCIGSGPHRTDGPARRARACGGAVATGARRNPTTSTASCTRPGPPVGPRAS